MARSAVAARLATVLHTLVTSRAPRTNDIGRDAARRRKSLPTAFGLCDLGLGCPELGYVSLNELRTVRGKLRLPIRQTHLCLRR